MSKIRNQNAKHRQPMKINIPLPTITLERDSGASLLFCTSAAHWKHYSHLGKKK